jgi:serine beta-lactamase-like protein LACTB
MPLTTTPRVQWASLLLVLLAFQLPAKEVSSPALDLLERWRVETGVPGISAAVAMQGQIVFSGGSGIADLQTGLPQTGATVHNVGSISKVLAAVAVMQLVEKGLVKLDAEIQAYAPWFPRKSQPITVRQLLTHTSGIRHYKEGEFGPGDVMSFRHYDSFEESTRYWRDDALLFAPGTRYQYSSYAANLMHAIVESASGRPFEAYMQEQVWGPARMVNTRFDVPARIVKNRGRGYVRNQKTGVLENAPDEDVSYKYAGGGMLSTDEDLCRFGHALNVGLLLQRESLAQMYKLQLAPDIPWFDPADQASPSAGKVQALIFRVGPDSLGRLYAGHSGSVKGTRSQFFNYFKDGIVVALHFNSDPMPLNTREAAEALASLYLARAKSK